MPSTLGLIAGAIALREFSERFYGPGFAHSLGNAAHLSGELMERYRRQAEAVLDALPAQPPATPELVARLAQEAEVDFVAWQSAPTAAPPLGAPGPDDWQSLEEGLAPPAQVGPALRFFRPGNPEEGIGGRAVGWMLPPETAATLRSARGDLGRARQLDLRWRAWQVGLRILAPLLLLLAAALAFIVARRTARRIAAPVTELSAAANAIAAGDLSRRVEARSEGEVGHLVAAFNRMGGQLQQSQEKLRAAERLAAWGDVARRVAHEIRNPLTPIRLAAHRLQRRVPESDQASRECLQSIVEEAESLERIATAFSEFAKMPPPRPEPLDFAALASGVVELFAETIPGATIRYEGPPSLTVVADRDQLRRVLMNLVKNAAEAVSGREGGGQIEVRLEDRDGRARLQVRDNGPGLPAEIRDSLAKPGVSGSPGGSGLGLAMVHRIALDHQGELKWEDDRRGACFAFEIPRNRDETTT